MFAFRAMGTDVAVTADASLGAHIAEIFARGERRFSRFLAESELSQLNRAHGPVVVSPELFDALSRARTYHDLTAGIFDPATGGVLRALGYDRSFSAGALDRPDAGPLPAVGRFADVKLDPVSKTVERPEHIQIDLGGMIKGATVDLAAKHLGREGALDAGGDAVVRGRALVDVEDPLDPRRTLFTVAVTDRAVATSAANRRRWRVGGTTAHHLIDPRTFAPAVTDLLQVTVFAPSAELAEVLAKTAFLLGAARGRRFLVGRDAIAAILVGADGRPAIVGDLDVRGTP